MNQKPGIFSILLNDSTAASTLGGLAFALSVTGITYLTKAILGRLPDNINPAVFLWLCGILLPVSVVVSLWRIRLVTDIFENGAEVTAQVLESKIFRTRWTLKLRYFHDGQYHEITHIQLIAGKSKYMLEDKQVNLVIDQRDPGRILMRDVYL